MKILVVTQYYYPEPLRINEICEELVKRGHVVTVLTTNPNYPNGDIYDGYKNEYNTEIIKGVKVIRCKSRPRYKGNFNLALNYMSFCIKAGICAFNLKEEFDVVYAYQLSPVTSVIPAIIYKKLHNVPLYIYCLDIWPESIKDFIQNENNPIFKSTAYLSKVIYQSATMIGITSKSFKKYLIDVCNVSDNVIQYLPQHAEDIGECPKTEDNGSVDFYFTGNIGESQNIDLIIDAANMIKDTSNFTINFVGSGSKLEYAVDKVKKLGLDNKIIFHGRHPSSEMQFYFRQANACILTLNNNCLTGLTIPGKMQTYMAAGKIIIAAIEGDAAEIIIDRKCGFVVKADDVVGFSNLLRHFILNHERYDDMIVHARKCYVEKFTLRIHIEKLIKALDIIYKNNNLFKKGVA